MEIITKHINRNYSVGRKIKAEFIVIHETDNKRRGADAEAHYRYWNSNPSANTSVHYVVDDKKAIQLLHHDEKAWHVGDNVGYSKITNNNSIGIEICVNEDGDFEKAYLNCTELVAIVMKQSNIPIENVVRHFDASGKNCPRNIIKNNLWEKFKEEVLRRFNKTKKIHFNQRTKWIQILANQLNIKDMNNQSLVVDGILGERTLYAIKKLPVLKKWCSYAVAVKHIQNLLGINADGIFGDKTEQKVKAWQKSKFLIEDGVVGYDTWKSFSE